MTQVAAIILAAGASRRLGTPKQFVRLGTETLLERTVRVALEAGLEPVLGVVSPGLAVEPIPAGMLLVVNREAVEGMASSIRAGIHALVAGRVKVSGAVILACDQPAVTAGHVRQLAEGKTEIIASSYSGRNGIPAYFPQDGFEALRALHGDLGARHLLHNAKALPLPNGELDIDTMQDLDRARKLHLTESL